MKTQKLLLTLSALVIISWPSYSLATSGCCSWHDGVCGCSGGRQQCCDGTLSPSCTCAYNPPKSTIKTITSAKVDYEAFSIKLREQINSTEKDLKTANDSIAQKDKLLKQNDQKINDLQDLINTQSAWLWILGIVLFFALSNIIFRDK